ncbi:LolA family protein [Thermostaphylospora chromogena]|uniref:LolA family protein n=1 Tax=Thermostaphylospora chromogena TaxID=35622 RepID=UPI001F61B9D0|nr:DUF2092 domain-containing protein [Thermostaphylospora chromogena]
MRWGVPIAAVAVVGAVLGTGPVIAAVQGDPVLPDRTAEQLLTEVVRAAQKDEMPPMSGTIVETASLGIPGLPADAGAPGSLASLLSGSHEVRVWYGGERRLRLAVPGRMSETDLIVNGDQVWMWESSSNTATRIKTAEGGPRGRDVTGRSSPPPGPVTPQDAARLFLDAVDEHTAVSVTADERVAGRAAYRLVLTPEDPRTLVREVRLVIDGETYTPLRVQVFAQGAIEPAFEVGYSSVTFSPPAPENFAFTPPPGARVEERTLGAQTRPEHPRMKEAAKKAGSVTTRGQGWTTVVVAPFDPGLLDTGSGEAARDERRDTAALGEAVLRAAKPVSGAWGSGRLIETKLVTALLTDDGRLLAGAVTPDVLYEAAGRG